MPYLSLAVSLLLLTTATLEGQPAHLIAVGTSSVNDHEQVEIEVTGSFTYESHRVHNPERIFIDLHGTIPDTHDPFSYIRGTSTKAIKRIRVGLNAPTTTRVVMDLAAAFPFTMTRLSGPERLAVDLHERRALPGRLVSPDVPNTPGTQISKPPKDPPVFSIFCPLLVTRFLPLSELLSIGKQKYTAWLAPASPDFTARTGRIKQPSWSLSDSALRIPASRALLLKAITRTLSQKVDRVVIDAGHGGRDTGTVGPGGLLEKDLALDVALQLGELIGQRMSSDVVYTRIDDRFVPLEKRTAIANQSHGDLFLSIHANASAEPEVAGIESYYLKSTDAVETRLMMPTEDAAAGASVLRLDDLVQMLSLRNKLERSKRFADKVQSAMQAFNMESFPTARNRGVRRAPFVVLLGASMPSVLTEIGFLTNPQQEKLLSDPEYRHKVAEALYEGVRCYIESLRNPKIRGVENLGSISYISARTF